MIRISGADFARDLYKGFHCDDTFDLDVPEDGLNTFSIHDQIPWYIFCIFRDALFICDYVTRRRPMRFNPFGSEGEAFTAGRKLIEVIGRWNPNAVRGVNYVLEYEEWQEPFQRLLAE